MGAKKVLAELVLAVALAAAWVAACYLAAQVAYQGGEPFGPGWWQTAAWTAWWVGAVAGMASLLAGAMTGLSDSLGADRSARILLRATCVAAATALGLGVQALLAPTRPPRLTPDDFLLSYSRAESEALFLQTGSSALLMASASFAAVALLCVALSRQAKLGRFSSLGAGRG